MMMRLQHLCYRNHNHYCHYPHFHYNYHRILLMIQGPLSVMLLLLLLSMFLWRGLVSNQNHQNITNGAFDRTTTSFTFAIIQRADNNGIPLLTKSFTNESSSFWFLIFEFFLSVTNGKNVSHVAPNCINSIDHLGTATLTHSSKS
jgi:hypothetical protein